MQKCGIIHHLPVRTERRTYTFCFSSEHIKRTVHLKIISIEGDEIWTLKLTRKDDVKTKAHQKR